MADEQVLKALWKNVFGDSDEIIDTFFEMFYEPELTVTVKSGGEIVSAGYVLPVGGLVTPAGEGLPCAFIYAVATLPEYRRRGFGAAVTEEAVRRGNANGYPAVVLHPAEPELFDFYERHGEFETAFHAEEAEITREELVPAGDIKLRSVSPSDYRMLRETQLKGHTHIDMDERCLGFQERLCVISGGGLFVVSAGGADIGCAVVECGEDGTVNIKELLTDKHNSAVSAAAERFPADNYHVRTPVYCPCGQNGKKHRFGMLAPLPGGRRSVPILAGGWFGPAFD